MQNESVVSIIIPVYQVEAFLDRCLNSVVNQTYEKIEIILVDDGSPDECGSMCDEWAGRDDRIKVIHKNNEGLGYARNSGLSIATGEYIVFIDSDDYIKKDYINKLVTQMLYYNADLGIGGFIRKYDNREEEEYPVTEKIKIVEQRDIINEVLLPVLGSEPTARQDVEREMCVWRNMYRKNIIDDLNLRFVSEREYVSEDIFFNMIYFINTKRAVLIPDCIYYYCENGGSLTNTFRADRFEKYCKMLKRQQELLIKNNLYEVARFRLYRTFIMKTKKCIALLASSNLTFRKKKIECKRILEDSTLQNILRDYDNSCKQNFKQKLITVCMKNSFVSILLLYYKLKSI